MHIHLPFLPPVRVERLHAHPVHRTAVIVRARTQARPIPHERASPTVREPANVPVTPQELGLQIVRESSVTVTFDASRQWVVRENGELRVSFPDSLRGKVWERFERGHSLDKVIAQLQSKEGHSRVDAQFLGHGLHLLRLQVEASDRVARFHAYDPESHSLRALLPDPVMRKAAARAVEHRKWNELQLMMWLLGKKRSLTPEDALWAARRIGGGARVAGASHTLLPVTFRMGWANLPGAGPAGAADAVETDAVDSESGKSVEASPFRPATPVSSSAASTATKVSHGDGPAPLHAPKGHEDAVSEPAQSGGASRSGGVDRSAAAGGGSRAPSSVASRAASARAMSPDVQPDVQPDVPRHVPETPLAAESLPPSSPPASLHESPVEPAEDEPAPPEKSSAVAFGEKLLEAFNDFAEPRLARLRTEGEVLEARRDAPAKRPSPVRPLLTDRLHIDAMGALGVPEHSDGSDVFDAELRERVQAAVARVATFRLESDQAGTAERGVHARGLRAVLDTLSQALAEEADELVQRHEARPYGDRVSEIVQRERSRLEEMMAAARHALEGLPGTSGGRVAS